MARTCAVGPPLSPGLALSAPVPARGQLFIASRQIRIHDRAPHPAGQCHGGDRSITVDVLWSIVLPPGRSAADAAQDVYLLWPGEVTGDPTPGRPIPLQLLEEIRNHADVVRVDLREVDDAVLALAVVRRRSGTRP
mgnify:CR=1 FL=1